MLPMYPSCYTKMQFTQYLCFRAKNFSAFWMQNRVTSLSRMKNPVNTTFFSECNFNCRKACRAMLNDTMQRMLLFRSLTATLLLFYSLPMETSNVAPYSYQGTASSLQTSQISRSIYQFEPVAAQVMICQNDLGPLISLARPRKQPPPRQVPPTLSIGIEDCSLRKLTPEPMFASKKGNIYLQEHSAGESMMMERGLNQLRYLQPLNSESNSEITSTLPKSYFKIDSYLNAPPPVTPILRGSMPLSLRVRASCLSPASQLLKCMKQWKVRWLWTMSEST